MADWFSQNGIQTVAPPSSLPPSGGDWFSQNGINTVSAKPVDNGIPLDAGTGPVGPQHPGFWGTLGNDISGIPHMVANIGRLSGIGQTQDSFNQAYHELADPNLNLIRQGAHETVNGGWLGGPVHVAEGLIPGVGPMAHQAAQDFEQGHVGAGAARMLEIGAPSVLHGTLPLLPDELPAPVARAVAVTKGSGKGAWEGGTNTIPVNLRKYGVGVKFAAPAPLVGAGLGADAGALLGLPFGMAKPGAAIGAVAGTVAPIIKGAIKGSRTALADFNDAVAAAQETPHPDYSDLLTMPGAGVPPYQSSVIPEPGSVAREAGARPVVTRSPELPSAPLPNPSVIVDWLGRPVMPETAPAPAPASFVSTSGSRLIEPWKPTVAINIDTPSGVKKIQVPADAITAPPATQPSSARAVALTKGKSTASPPFAPVGASAPSRAELFQSPLPASAQPALAPPEGFLGSAEDQSRYLGNLVSGVGKNRHLISPAPIPIDTGVGGTDLNLYKPGYGQVVLGKPAEGGIEVFGKAQAGPKGIENLGVSPQYQGKGLSQVLLKEVDKSGFPVKSVPGNPVSTAGAAAINKYTNPLESQVTAVPPIGGPPASNLGSEIGHNADAAAKVHNLYDYFTTRPELTPDVLEKIAKGDSVKVGGETWDKDKVTTEAMKWARARGRTEGALGNPKNNQYSSFDWTNKRKGGIGSAQEVINMLRGQPHDVGHVRPGNYGLLPPSPHGQ